MNANSLATVVFVLFVLAVRAEERPSQLDALGVFGSKKVLDWDDPKWWEGMRKQSSGISLGKSDIVVKGPLVDTFRRAPRSSRDRSLGEKILNLPILSLFVPQPMPRPGRGGKYFSWGEREAPWSMVSASSTPGPQGLISAGF